MATKMPEPSGADYFRNADKLTSHVLTMSEDKENEDPTKGAAMKSMVVDARLEQKKVSTSLDALIAEVSRLRSDLDATNHQCDADRMHYTIARDEDKKEIESLKAGRVADRQERDAEIKGLKTDLDATEARVKKLEDGHLVSARAAVKLGKGQMRYDMLKKLRGLEMAHDQAKGRGKKYNAPDSSNTQNHSFSECQALDS